MTKLILGTEKPSPEALQQMRERGGDCYAYQNHALDSAGLGDLQFLQCGQGRTYQTPPARMLGEIGQVKEKDWERQTPYSPAKPR
jgi:hypothetical protein